MHPVTIPSHIRDRILARRGRAHVFDPLDPSRTALLVVDMQRVFLDPGAPVEVAAARRIVPQVNRLCRAARAVSVPVVWLYMTAWEKNGETSWPLFFDRLVSPEFRSRQMAALTRGAELHALAAEMEPEPGDWHIDKTRFSAFIPGSSDLDAQLRARGIDTLVITGTLTNRCCESTARDAMMMGYGIVFVEDATAALDDEEHLAALINIATGFGDVRKTAEVEELLAP